MTPSSSWSTRTRPGSRRRSRTTPVTADIANGANVAIGTVAYDTADVTGETAGAGGTVQFYVEKGDATCSVDGATDLGSKALGVKSNTTTFAEAGTYDFWAVYSGDANNKGATSACDSETVIVDKNTTTDHDPGQGTNAADGHDTRQRRQRGDRHRGLRHGDPRRRVERRRRHRHLQALQERGRRRDHLRHAGGRFDGDGRGRHGHQRVRAGLEHLHLQRCRHLRVGSPSTRATRTTTAPPAPVAPRP